MIDDYTISLWKAWYWTLNPSDDNKQSVLQSCKDVLKDPSQVVEKLCPILHEYSMTKFTGSSVLRGDVAHISMMANSVADRCRLMSE